MARPHTLVDVFAPTPLSGNPLAVISDAEGLTDAQMLQLTRWFNLSETTFLLPPTQPGADYRVRIFTPHRELPFAGHPTLGTAQVWLDRGGRPAADDVIVQECGIGLVEVRRTDVGLAFAAPPQTRSGPVDDEDLARICEILRIDGGQVVDAAWTDNGPGWATVLLGSADAVLALTPVGSTTEEADIGVVGLHPAGGAADLEVRAFFSDDRLILREDPVTGSLNAAAAQWLTSTGRITAPYTAAQGTALGRGGRVHVTEADGHLWIGGAVATVSSGDLTL